MTLLLCLYSGTPHGAADVCIYPEQPLAARDLPWALTNRPLSLPGRLGCTNRREDNDPAGFRQREVSQCPESCAAGRAVPARLPGAQKGALQK